MFAIKSSKNQKLTVKFFLSLTISKNLKIKVKKFENNSQKIWKIKGFGFLKYFEELTEENILKIYGRRKFKV